MIYAKYEFQELPDFEALQIKGSVVILGNLVITEGTYDEEGNVITAPVISDKVAVDIIYHDLQDASLEPYRITPETPKSFIGGMEQLYRDSILDTQNRLLIADTLPEVLSKDDKERPTHLRYFSENGIYDETLNYKGMNVECNLYRTDTDIVPTFREWEISEYPVGIKRKAYLVELKVNKDIVKVSILIKHYNQDGSKAHILDKLMFRIADEGKKEFELNGELVGERTYWDYLTENGASPYHLLDARIPELDNQGKLSGY